MSETWSRTDKEAAIFGTAIILMAVFGTGFVAWREQSEYHACIDLGGDRVIDRQCVRLVPVPPSPIKEE